MYAKPVFGTVPLLVNLYGSLCSLRDVYVECKCEVNLAD